MKVTQRLLGVPDSRSSRAIFSRGSNVYHGTSNAAHSGGGPQYGRPKKKVTKQAIQRRRSHVNSTVRYH